MHQNRWRLRLRPRPHWESLQRFPDSQAGFNGAHINFQRGIIWQVKLCDIVNIASFEYEIFVVQSIYNIGSFRQVRVNNVSFVVQYFTNKRAESVKIQ